MKTHITILALMLTSTLAGNAYAGDHNPCSMKHNPCAAKSADKHQNPCNPCQMKSMKQAEKPHNPCAAKAHNPCKQW